tara:strand:+ start:557 stop:676 length:120 start_codon:yes stop_codon:yes gene_type:complete
MYFLFFRVAEWARAMKMTLTISGIKLYFSFSIFNAAGTR